MSTARVGRRLPRALTDSPQDTAAVACVAVVVATYLSVLYDVTAVVGTSTTLVAVVAGALALAGVLRALPGKYAFALAVALLVAGLAAYLLSVPRAYYAALSPGRVLKDTVALLTGYSVLRMPAAGTWAVAVAPAPTFLAAYFTARREYARAAGLAAAALGFFVLTGDASTTVTLVGVLAAAGAVAFETLALHDASTRQVQVVAAVLAVMVVASATVTAVPGGRSPLVPAEATTTAGSLVNADSYVGVGGELRLDPQVHFVAESDQPTYYRGAVYDRFTGNGWTQTADVGTERGTPPPTGDRITQRITVERRLDIAPAAAVPQTIRGLDAELTEGGLLQGTSTLYPGDSYEVVSRAPPDDTDVLARETGVVPETIRDRYLQVPESTSGDVVDLADRITADAETPYRQAEAIEAWLEANKEYSLDAPNTQGDLVNEFVLRGEVGYCTYYASAMTVMLRSQDVPARFVVGFTEGQRVSEDEYVVRGVDSHAWVEVYVPDRGWVTFDPTPASERTSAEESRVEQARSEGVSGVDAAGSENGTWTPPQTTTPQTSTDSADTEDGNNQTAPRDRESYFGTSQGVESPENATVPANLGDGAGGDAGGDGSTPDLPPLTTLAVWGVLVVGAAAALRYTGITDRAYRALWLRWLPDGDPAAEVEAAFERVEYVLGQRYRERRSGETVREYVADVAPGDAAERAAVLRERARYAGSASDEDAAEAKRLARSLAGEYSRLPSLRR
ncbi:transglutaminaseTgpA domain-containing protein [Halobacterium jilantaiense]|uniref:Transglutaminase-like superfamily protein n=1 Tax=Halobacterium jilantaiense TaxID=355548 RepID=A0A1I0PE45_9EURY|nr:transglutaminaseTgpA domain-containing protein [Halobacterium jilantaiense]SEW12572.1 Transglutaminase-like superfamily protein [Halobacterium jilantaiense]